MKFTICRCRQPIRLDGNFADYCGNCGKTLRETAQALRQQARRIVVTPNERQGTSTAPEEAGLREIGLKLFGISYPEDA
jgi:hypothetical protein